MRDMLLDPSVDIDAIAKVLDALDHGGRYEALMGLNRKEQRALWKFAAASPAVDIDHFVASHVAPGVPVPHHGRNTLPVLPSWRMFQKVFCRPQDGSSRLFGYNEGSLRPLIGPGYFVAYSTADKPEWRERGGVVVDYYQVPDGPVVEGWPEVVPNDKGVQYFVLNGTRDFMRKVSEHVGIGTAYKNGKSLDHYFLTLRED